MEQPDIRTTDIYKQLTQGYKKVHETAPADDLHVYCGTKDEEYVFTRFEFKRGEWRESKAGHWTTFTTQPLSKAVKSIPLPKKRGHEV